MNLLTMEHITKAYTDRVLLNDVAFSINENEKIGVIGINGMGKSTALSIICSLNKPYRGKVEISPLNKNSFDTLVAVLPQNPQTLFLKKTVLEDLYEVFDGRKISKEEKERRVTSAVKLCRLESLCNRHPYDLSGGEQQRVALARALVNKPALLLADEPTGNLDTQNTSEVIALLKEASRLYEQTIVMITHSQSIAQTADRILRVSDGVVTDLGRCKE